MIILKKEELTKLFREGTMVIIDSGISIKDKVTSCYTLKNGEETYIYINFSSKNKKLISIDFK